MKLKLLTFLVCLPILLVSQPTVTNKPAMTIVIEIQGESNLWLSKDAINWELVTNAFFGGRIIGYKTTNQVNYIYFTNWARITVCPCAITNL